ncbi:MAG TPA: hypothetical protein PLG16_10130 [Planctomycetota bacterium]|nr:hypothetical protein [Planctomycetota bacterium]
MLWGETHAYSEKVSVALGRNARILWESICCSGEKRTHTLRKYLLLWGETHAYSGKVSVALGRNELERNAK